MPGGQTALDRARTIARALYDSRHSVEQIEAVAAMARRLGETWLTAHRDASHPDDLMTAEQVAEIAGVQRGTVYVWSSRGIAGRDGRRLKLRRLPGGYHPDDVEAFLAERDTPEKFDDVA
jgi:hypothetical protein